MQQPSLKVTTAKSQDNVKEHSTMTDSNIIDKLKNNINDYKNKANKNDKTYKMNKVKAAKFNSTLYNKYKFNNYNMSIKDAKLPISKTSNTSKSLPTIGKLNKVSGCINNTSLTLRYKNIPQTTLNCERKHRQKIANTIHSYNIQQREAEILRQKRILEGMLKEHQILETNRRNIKQEIQSMKIFINEIRAKLDKSLLKLGDNKTIFSLTQNRKPSSATPGTSLFKKMKNKNVKNNLANVMHENN